MAANRSIEEIARMTENYLPAATPPQRGEPFPPASAEEQGTADVVKDQATDLSHSSVQKEQAAQGQRRLASQLLSLSDELRSMAGASGQGGMAAGLASQAASRVGNAGQWLEDREPGQVAEEVQSFARRRPAVFLALAVGAGLVAGRLTRGLKDANSDDSAAAAPAAAPGLSGQRARPSDMASYPPATAAGVSDQTPGLSVPASGLPLAGGDPAWEAGPAYGERSPLVTDDQTGRQGTL
jgi:hypothetical protein